MTVNEFVNNVSNKKKLPQFKPVNYDSVAELRTLLDDLNNPKSSEESDMNKNKLNVVSIKEITKEVKIQQRKAVPKTETRKVVRVLLQSGNVWEAVCSPLDESKYDIKEAVKVAILCEVFGGKKEYNDFLRKAEKAYKNHLKIEEEIKVREEIKKRKEEKAKRRKDLLMQRKKAAKRQEKIDIQTEAILKALRMYKEENDSKSFETFVNVPEDSIKEKLEEVFSSDNNE